MMELTYASEEDRVAIGIDDAGPVGSKHSCCHDDGKRTVGGIEQSKG